MQHVRHRRSAAHLVFRVFVRAVRHQHRCSFGHAITRGVVQRGPAVLHTASSTHVDASEQTRRRAADGAHACEMHGSQRFARAGSESARVKCRTCHVLDGFIYASLQQQRHDGRVALVCGEGERSGVVLRGRGARAAGPHRRSTRQRCMPGRNAGGGGSTQPAVNRTTPHTGAQAYGWAAGARSGGGGGGAAAAAERLRGACAHSLHLQGRRRAWFSLSTLAPASRAARAASRSPSPTADTSAQSSAVLPIRCKRTRGTPARSRRTRKARARVAAVTPQQQRTVPAATDTGGAATGHFGLAIGPSGALTRRCRPTAAHILCGFTQRHATQ
jgi:hypothetical protein